MDKDRLCKAEAEAERFLTALHALQRAQPNPRRYGNQYEGGVETGAVRRASMDLTRALADLRRSSR
jgi:hypothetical protein